MLRAFVSFGIVMGASVVGATAFAAPLGPSVAKAPVSSSDTLTPSTKFTAAEAKQKNPSFSTTKTYKTASGGTITGQQYLDLANKLQAAAEKAGCSLGSGKECNFVVSEAKLTSTQLSQAATLASYKFTTKKVTVSPVQGTPPRQAKNPLGFSWSNDWGNHSTGAVYVGAEFGTNGGTASTTCGGSAYAGVYLFNNKKEIVRLESEAASSGSTFSASTELFVMGDSVWSKSGAFSGGPSSFEKSFSVSKSFSYWGLITISLSAKATGTAYVSGSVSGIASSGNYACALALTPGVKATVGATVEVSLLGYGKLSAGAVGIESDVTLADLSLPTAASASSKQAGPLGATFSESVASMLKMTYLKGSLDAYFKTKIPLDGEKIWDWDSDKFTFTLLEWDGKTYESDLYRKSQSQSL